MVDFSNVVGCSLQTIFLLTVIVLAVQQRCGLNDITNSNKFTKYKNTKNVEFFIGNATFCPSFFVFLKKSNYIVVLAHKLPIHLIYLIPKLLL